MDTDTARGGAAIVIVSRDATVLKALSEELSGRYGVDYQIVVCDEPAELDSRIRELLGAGTPVALVIGGAGEADPDGIEVLAQVREIREIAAAPNIDATYGVQITGGTGTDRLESLVMEDRQTQTRRSVPANALFVLIGSEPRTEWLGDAVARGRWGFILTGSDLLDDPDSHTARWTADRPPLLHETSLPGVFAAGDVRRGSVKRVGSAVGDGATTVPVLHRYLESLAATTVQGR